MTDEVDDEGPASLLPSGFVPFDLQPVDLQLFADALIPQHGEYRHKLDRPARQPIEIPPGHVLVDCDPETGLWYQLAPGGLFGRVVSKDLWKRYREAEDMLDEVSRLISEYGEERS